MVNVLSYLGRDPDGMRGSFEGFVAVVDQQRTTVLTRLVDNAETLLPLLPWPREFEKDKFSKPDFTDLTVVAYANGAPPEGTDAGTSNSKETFKF